MGSSPPESGRRGPDSPHWLEIRVRVPDSLGPLLSQLLLDLGATGLAEDHPGLHYLDDDEAPLLSGDGGWSPPPPPNPTPDIQVRGWFPLSSDDASAAERTHGEVLRWLQGQGLEADRLDSADLADQDWNRKWREHFSDFRLSPRLHVVPSWLDLPALPTGVGVLRLDPDMAFGSGTHFTSSACARLIDAWMGSRHEPPTSVLDVGTGTGILALAALRLGAARAVGVDTDPSAVASAQRNARRNGLDGRLELHLGGPEAAPPGEFDLVAANLLASVLVDLAPQLAARVGRSGRLVISGMLRDQAEATLRAFEPWGLRQLDRLEDDEWSAVLLGPN